MVPGPYFPGIHCFKYRVPGKMITINFFLSSIRNTQITNSNNQTAFALIWNKKKSYKSWHNAQKDIGSYMSMF